VVAAFSDHDGVKYQVGGLPVGQALCYGACYQLLAEHADFYGVYAHIGKQSVDLRNYEFGRDRRNGGDGMGILGCERGNYGSAVGA
jgi:hypothetical protein